jgi:hypothetical protein
MNCRVYWKRAVRTALVIFLLPQVTLCQNAREQMEKEIRRITNAIKAKPDSDKEWKDAKPDIVNALKGAHESLAAGRLFVAIEDLGDAWVNLAVMESMAGKPEVLKQGLSGFEAEWRQTGTDLKAWERRYEEGRKNALPLAVRAIAESNSAQSHRYYDSSRAYTNASLHPGTNDAKAGLNILGAAKGSIEFAIFCESLHFNEILPTPPLRPLAPELQQLEERMIAAYQPPRSIDKHQEFIQMHSALKEARDLEAEHLYAGALYKYLDALQMFEALETPLSGGTSTPEELQKKMQAVGKSFGSGTDSSIVQLFLERTESVGIAASDAKDPSRSQIQPAVITKLVSAYKAALEEREAPTQTTGKTITVTLVRWPYT